MRFKKETAMALKSNSDIGGTSLYEALKRGDSKQAQKKNPALPKKQASPKKTERKSMSKIFSDLKKNPAVRVLAIAAALAGLGKAAAWGQDKIEEGRRADYIAAASNAEAAKAALGAKVKAVSHEFIGKPTKHGWGPFSSYTQPLEIVYKGEDGKIYTSVHPNMDLDIWAGSLEGDQMNEEKGGFKKYSRPLTEVLREVKSDKGTLMLPGGTEFRFDK